MTGIDDDTDFKDHPLDIVEWKGERIRYLSMLLRQSMQRFARDGEILHPDQVSNVLMTVEDMAEEITAAARQMTDKSKWNIRPVETAKA